MANEATRRPWHIGMKPGPIIYGQDGAQVASLHVPMVPIDENAANALLIVDAVNLFDAHREAVEALREAISRLDADEMASPDEHRAEAIDRARAILSKIDGVRHD